jgi:hypothetical protein
MIFAPAQATYFCGMGSLLTAGNLSLRRLSVEDQLLNSAAIISIVDDDESMRCALKSLVASLGLKAHAFASAEQFLQSQRLDDTACLITEPARKLWPSPEPGRTRSGRGASGGNGHAYRVWLRMNSFVGGYPIPHFKQAKPISLSL